jgi:hypothetical protein
MQLDEEAKKLQTRIAALSDEELLTMVEVEAAEYREDAIEFAKAELLARGIAFSEGPAEDSGGFEDAEEGIEDEPLPVNGTRTPPICSVCGGETRFGILFAGRELTMLFPEDRLERAVEAYACRNCGRVQLILDAETIVQREEA